MISTYNSLISAVPKLSQRVIRGLREVTELSRVGYRRQVRSGTLPVTPSPRIPPTFPTPFAPHLYGYDDGVRLHGPKQLLVQHRLVAAASLDLLLDLPYLFRRELRCGCELYPVGFSLARIKELYE